MSYKNFHEYLNHKNTIAKPKVEKLPDYHGPKDTMPPKEEKHKDAGGKGQVGSANPYKGGTDAKNPNKSEKGFADEGDKKLKYEPKIDQDNKKVKTWPKTNTQEWIDSTKELSLAEFTKLLREKTIGENKDPIKSYDSLRTLVELCQKDKSVIVNLVREMKRNELLQSLMAEMLNHPESLKVIKDDNKILNELFSKMGPPSKLKPEMPPPETDEMDDMGGDMGDDMSDGEMEGGEDEGEEDLESEDELDMDSEEGDMEGEEDALEEPEGELPPPKKHVHASHALSKMHRPMMDTPMMMKKK